MNRVALLSTSLSCPFCLQVFRISEHCGSDCHPDMLAEHNSGDLLADVRFVHTRVLRQY